MVLDNRQVHYFGNGKLWSRAYCDKEQSGSFIIKGHKIESITSGYYHSIVFGFGRNNNHQLGVVDPSALLGDIVSTPNEVFAAITKFKGAVRLPNGSVIT